MAMVGNRFVMVGMGLAMGLAMGLEMGLVMVGNRLVMWLEMGLASSKRWALFGHYLFFS